MVPDKCAWLVYAEGGLKELVVKCTLPMVLIGIADSVKQ